MYGIIVFENHRFYPSKRKREAGVFETCLFGAQKLGLRVDGRLKQTKKISVIKNIRIRVGEALHSSQYWPPRASGYNSDQSYSSHTPSTNCGVSRPTETLLLSMFKKLAYYS